MKSVRRKKPHSILSAQCFSLIFEYMLWLMELDGSWTYNVKLYVRFYFANIHLVITLLMPAQFIHGTWVLNSARPSTRRVRHVFFSRFSTISGFIWVLLTTHMTSFKMTDGISEIWWYFEWWSLTIWSTLLVLKPEYSGMTRSIPWLLMPWLLASPCQQQPWYSISRLNWSLFSTKKYFNYLQHFIIEKG